MSSKLHFAILPPAQKNAWQLLTRHSQQFNRLFPLRALVSFDDVAGEWPKLIDETIKNSWQQILCQAVKKAA